MKNLTKALIAIAVLFSIQSIEPKTDKTQYIVGLIKNYPSGEYNITKNTAYLEDKDGNRINCEKVFLSQKSSRRAYLNPPKNAPQNAVKFAYYPTHSKGRRTDQDTNRYLYGVLS